MIIFIPLLLSLTPPISTLYLPTPTFFRLLLTRKITQELQFGLLIYSWVWGHPLHCGQTSRSHTLKDNRSASSRSRLVSSSSSVRLGAHGPLSVLAWMLTGLILHSSCATNRSCCDLTSVAVLPCPEDTVALWSLLTSDSQPFHPLFLDSPWGVVRGWCIDTPFVADHSVATYSLHFGRL